MSIVPFGAGFDWIYPLWAFLNDLLRGPGYTFLIPYAGCPYSGAEIRAYLKKHGVDTWGAMIISGTITLTVKLNKARWADYLLKQAGIPVENPVEKKPPQKQRKQRSRKRCKYCGTIVGNKHKCSNCGAPQ